MLPNVEYPTLLLIKMLNFDSIAENILKVLKKDKGIFT